MVRRARKKALLEPGDTEQQWLGKPPLASLGAGITSSHALPTSSAGYWFPLSSVNCTMNASEAICSFGGIFSCLGKDSRAIVPILWNAYGVRLSMIRHGNAEAVS